MPTVNVKFIAYELTPGLESGKYDIADGSTVRDVISLCENQCGASVPPDNFKRLYPLFNGKPVTLDHTITKDGTLHVCRVVMGG
jgi:hypothetical protein